MSKICFYRFFVCFKIPGLNDKRLRSQGTRGPHRLKPPWHIMTPTIVDDGKLQLSQLRLPKFPAISMVGDVSVVSWWSLGVSVVPRCFLVLSCWIPPSEQTRLIPYHHFSRFSCRKRQFYGYGIFVIWLCPKLWCTPNLDYFVIIFPINMNMWWIDIGTPKQIERQFLNPFLFLLVHPLGVVISHFQTIPFLHRGER